MGIAESIPCPLSHNDEMKSSLTRATYHQCGFGDDLSFMWPCVHPAINYRVLRLEAQLDSTAIEVLDNASRTILRVLTLLAFKHDVGH